MVIAIIASILAIALPYFGAISRRARLDSVARGVDFILIRARIEAVKRGSNVFVEVSTNTGKTSYRNPVMFLDTNGNGSYDGSATDQLLGSYPFPPAASQVTLRIDDYGKATPGTTSQTIDYIFANSGSMSTTPVSTTKAAFVSDTSGNVLQVGVPAAASGKVAITKQLIVSGVTTYVSPPWKWY